MIYLIDDKKLRQEKDFGWTSEKLKSNKNYITPIYTLEELENIKREIFINTNTVIYHESFLDNTTLEKEAALRRDKLEKFAEENESFNLVIFSGSKSSRTINQNIAHVPVSIVYQNLDVFIKKTANNELDINYLAFGNNPNIENELLNKLEDSLIKLENVPVKIENQTSLFITTPERDIQNPIESTVMLTLYDEESDENISKFITDNLEDSKYDIIFIPLCYGNSLSDFNGLRLAAHIRCTSGLNQLTRIFIYGFVGFEFLIQNKYFNILKTKNVNLVGFSKQDFKNAAATINIPLTMEELPAEMEKLKLDPPKNYYDSHGIANEWAIHQWAKTIGCDETEELTDIFQRIQSNLYFKYLKVINPIHKQDRISYDKLKIDFKGNPKVLLIDDEIDKGWEEIFAYLLYDRNKIDVDYLGHDFKKSSSDEIIQQTINKIKSDDIDVCILDFRLNQSDFESKTNEETTSIKILKKIKEEINPGIQVIVFSATNKVWNLQALQNAGADGFVIKGAPENSFDSSFTLKNIENFINLFEAASKKVFLKDSYRLIFKVKQNLEKCDYEDDSEFENFILELKSQINFIEQGARQIKTHNSISLDTIFLSCYNFFEMLKNFYIREIQHSYYIGIEELPLNRYSYRHKSLLNEGDFIRKSTYDSPSWFQAMIGITVDYFEVLNNNDSDIETLWQVKNWRNDYIHNNKSSFSQNELLKITELMVKATISFRE